jgi:hypothetical protein
MLDRGFSTATKNTLPCLRPRGLTRASIRQLPGSRSLSCANAEKTRSLHELLIVVWLKVAKLLEGPGLKDLL